MEYELLFFTSATNEEKIPEIKKEITEIITSLGGKMSTDFSDIGKRKLAYPIRRQTHGFYSFCRFLIDKTGNISEINRLLSLNDKIMRHLIVRADEIGKPLATQLTHESKSEMQKEEAPQKKTVSPSIKTKAKIEMEELDEKLSEILEETPK